MATLNPPDNWTIYNGAGVWSVDITEDTTTAQSGDFSIRFADNALAGKALISDNKPLVANRYYKATCLWMADDNTSDIITAVALRTADSSGTSDIAAVIDVVAGPVHTANVWCSFSEVFFVPDTSPRIRFAAMLIGVDDANVLARCDHALINPCPGRFRVSRNANQSIAHNTDTTVSWNQRDIDPALAVNTSTGIFTAPYASTWRFESGIVWGANAATTGRFDVRILVNGTEVGRTADVSGTTAFSRRQQASSGVCELQQGDQVKVNVFQTDGAAVNVLTNDSTWFSGYEIGVT